VACPTGSIGTREPVDEVAEAASAFPVLIDGDVYDNGYHSRKSFGAASYFIRRPSGNVLVDSPRYNERLARRLDELGGVRYLLLTHRDDVADHAQWHDRFGCERLLHRDDVSAATRHVEIQPEGGDPVALADDLLVLPVPGHTRGHVVVHHADRFLFTGDHLAFSPELGHLYAFRRHCWYSWPRQVESMRTLLARRFEWVLPGHGRRFHATAGQARRSLERCLAWMERAA
jgi:glyoxylase-like metal-dependent hydrolase (beta-lactamase superfamily II)